jgi:hypothetical protein
MGDGYSSIGEISSSAQYTRKAFELRTGVSDLEKLLIEALRGLITTTRPVIS